MSKRFNTEPGESGKRLGKKRPGKKLSFEDLEASCLLFVLDEDGEPRKEPDMFKWTAWFKNRENRVVQQDTVEGILVSTVFLGIPHPGGMFETMVFEGPYKDCQWRYRTREEALKGHAAVLALILDRN